MKKAGRSDARIVLANQVTDRNYSIRKVLKKSQVSLLAKRVHSEPDGLTLFLQPKTWLSKAFARATVDSMNAKEKSVFVWVGNSETQCPGQCAWSNAANGDVGVDGMIINIASLLAGAVTGPYGNERKYLLPALFDPVTSQCSTLV
ncbi:hypothetical protein ES319_D05G237500v1 [Gossypium barbadense]|uniref:Uncharacterized protein n=2 Tax=Gossypium TaxID=3633 RepID=A0A5J5RI15_GOSBA|nr:hypothetical protein ES319_D05G237500v1 [Gossypium barbadense]PPD81524.1 hypothetical protein GOBAR_DD21557 [Gossypium barbadense]TYG69667.1 hypothetical protein ES288_D05G249000v1 [Gossypium darwinii]